MRRLILQTSVSIDGYVAALDKSHPWSEGSEEDEAFKRWILDSVWAAGAHLMGARAATAQARRSDDISNGRRHPHLPAALDSGRLAGRSTPVRVGRVAEPAPCA
jgi:hypothetical protein